MSILPTDLLDPAASDDTSENARDGARKRRDPNEPAAVVGLGASAGGIAVLQQFFTDMSPESGLAFVVVMHLSPEHESNLANIIQQKTTMPVEQVSEPLKVKPNHVYVIPPNKQLAFEEGMLQLFDPQQAIGRRVTIDLFFRTLAVGYGQRSVCIVLSGTDSDGVIGLKHVRAQGGVTIAQDPKEAEYESMPLTAISTGMVDWVLPVAQMAPKLMEFVENENRMQLPPEVLEADEPDEKVQDAPGGETVANETRESKDETALREVLTILRRQTGHEFSHYKRATLLRRIARRMQVNSFETIPQYLEFLRQHPAEARELLHDLLIGVTHFFRDRASFASLEANIPQLFAGKHKDDQVRVWAAGCATGEEAYSIAMLLCEHAEKLDSPPSIQIFASDIDEQAIQDARNGVYPVTIEADVSPERLRHFFARDHGRYRVRKGLREKVLFAPHNLLSDAPFSNLDLVSCRNLLIYLNPKAQNQVFDIFHFALRSAGLLFIGGAESGGNVHTLFSPVDAKHRLYVRRSVPRPSWKIPLVPPRARDSAGLRAASVRTRPLPPLSTSMVEAAGTETRESSQAGQSRRAMLFGELHLKLLEQYGPPSVVVNQAYDIVHVSEHAGRYLQFPPGEPTANLMKVVHPALQIELRTSLFRAAQNKAPVESTPAMLEFDGVSEVVTLKVRPVEAKDLEQGFYLILFAKQDASETTATQPAPISHDAVTRNLEAEIEVLKRQLNDTGEQYEAANEELKASNEELQAINEEMRSATEELETSKEELQSVNEELVTVNNELKSSVEELSRTNSDLTNLMASTDIGTLFLDRQLRVQRFTPSAQKVFNLIPADVGRPISDITHKLTYGSLVEDAEEVLENLMPVEREVHLADQQWYLVRIAPYRTGEDRIAGVVATFIDITRRARAEEELRELHERTAAQLQKFNTVMAAVPDFVYEFDLQGRFTYVSQSLLDLWQLTPEKAIGRNFYELDYPPELASKLQRQIQEVIQTRKSLKDEMPYTRGRGTRIHEYILFPLPTDGSVEGVGGVTRDVTERRLTEDALRKSEKRLQMGMMAGDIFSWEMNPATRELEWSSNMEVVIGFPLHENIDRTFELVHPEDRTALIAAIDDAIENGGNYESEYRLIQPGTGEIFWLHSQGTLTTSTADGSPRFVGVTQNITERKRTQEALEQSEARMRRAFEIETVGIIYFEPSGRIIDANEAFLLMSGFSRDDIATGELTWKNMTPEEFMPRSQQAIEEFEKRGFTTPYEKQYFRKDGSLYWALFAATKLPDGEGVEFIVDISDQKWAEEALRESEERFRQFGENSADVLWITDAKTRQLEYLSPAYEKVWGEPRDAIMRDVRRWEELLHPDDRGLVEGTVEQLLSGENSAVEYRIIRPNDGAVRWIRDTGFPIRDKGGKIARVAGVAHDLTAEKLQVEELKGVQERLQLLIEGARDYAMFLIGLDNRIVYWSAGAERIFGWTAEEAVGQFGGLIFTPEDAAIHREETELEIARREGCANDRRWHLRKDGSRIWVDGIMRRLDDEQGNLRGFCKVARDATEQRAADEELKRSRDELERRVEERTAELTASNRKLETEITQRSRLEQEILLISEREKRRIGHDLHDSLCQELAATAFLLESEAQKVAKKNPDEARTLSEAARTVNANVGVARDLARGLHPIELSTSGLANALRELAYRTEHAHKISCRCLCPKPIRIRDDTVALNLYRIAQEAVTNALKHGQATEISISLRRNAGLILTVADDGVGLRKKTRGKGMGVGIMQYRAKAIGAKLTVESNGGRGTKVVCVLPRT